MPSEKRPLFCGLHLSALPRRGLVTVSKNTIRKPLVLIGQTSDSLDLAHIASRRFQ